MKISIQMFPVCLCCTLPGNQFLKQNLRIGYQPARQPTTGHRDGGRIRDMPGFVVMLSWKVVAGFLADGCLLRPDEPRVPRERAAVTP